MQLRLLSYNIHKGIGGLDRRYNLPRIVDTIRRYQPDIALLQEVDDDVPRSRRDRQVELLAEALELPYLAYQRNVRLRVGHYGNATLSRFPLYDPFELNLTMPLKKRRGALIASCQLSADWGRATLVLANVHLGLAGYERKLQLRALLASDPIVSHHAATPLVVGGDFNDVWGNLGRHAMEPAGFRLASGLVRTFPAAAPIRRLDRVFVRGRLEPVSAFAGHCDLARRASDHRPLIVDLQLVKP